jgi:hypothetical protein
MEGESSPLLAPNNQESESTYILSLAMKTSKEPTGINITAEMFEIVCMAAFPLLMSLEQQEIHPQIPKLTDDINNAVATYS